jgi:hypothetical protein
MSNSVERPLHDESADEELSTSLAGHSQLPDHEDDSSAASTEDLPSNALNQGEPSPVLEEIEDSPVRTKNS